MSEKIFISIAAFMDPLLDNTIQNMIKNAENPERLVFGVCIQDTKEKIKQFTSKYASLENFKIITLDPKESKGCCWVRANIQKLMTDEIYFTQTDSHHVYVKHWDSLCVKMIKQCENLSKHNKVVLSTYGTPCRLPNFSCTHEDTAYYMKCEKFYSIPKIRYVPDKIPKGPDEPRLWHTISAHFLFAPKFWIDEIPYDPELYFDGEEDTLALRSYTHGYDIYYPYTQISYHFYTRKGEKRHSDIDKEWWKINEKAMTHLKNILTGKVKGKFGLGSVRTLEDYKEFTDIDYLNRVILTPETHHFGNSKFLKKGYEWKENDQYNFRELENSDEFYLIYDDNRKMYAKLSKQKRTFEISHDLLNWTILGPSNENKTILVYGHTTFTLEKTGIWKETSTQNSETWTFNEKENTNDYILLFDPTRNITLRCHKDLSSYEASWPPQHKFVALYGKPKKTIVDNPVQSLASKKKIEKYSDYYEFGYSEFKKVESQLWNEYCKQKKCNYNLKEIHESNECIVLNDTERSVQYKIYKDLSKLELKANNNKWFTLYVNGKNTIPKTIPVVSNEKDNTFSLNFNSDLTIICTGKSNVEFFEAIKTNHTAYAKKHKYNYFYYDDDLMYHSNYLLRHQKSKYILSTNIRCFFNNDTPLTNVVEEYKNANIICTSRDKFISKCAFIFKTHESNDYKLFENDQIYKSELSQNCKIDEKYIKDVKQDYTNALLVSCGALHPSKVVEFIQKANNMQWMQP
jgi:hypothetical protein